jgi:hypothetical protein
VAVTPISPPVGEFPSSTTPVMFSVTNLVGLVIAVDHSDSEVSRPVELVFADGVFLYPYLASSTLVGNTFSILRQGGWASFEERNKVRVFEQAPVPTTGQGLALIYEVDLRAQPSQAIGASGAYVIDGKTWWAKGLIAGLPFGASMSSALVSGSGLRLSIIGANAVMGASGNMDMRNLVLPLANVPDASLTAPTFIRAKFSYAYDSGAYAFIGLVNTTSDAAGYLAAQRSAETFVGPPNVSASAVAALKAKYGTGAITDVSARGGSAVYSSHFAGVQYVNGFTDVGDQTWDGSGAIPNLSAFKPQNQGLSQYEVGVLANPCIMFAVSGHVQDYYLTHLSVYQPKVAA